MPDQQKYINKLLSAKVLIIGGTSGIGYAVAEASLEHGASVIISSSNASRIESTIQKLQNAYPSRSHLISGYPCDLSNKDTIDANIATLFEKTGTVDHIVFTAGNSIKSPSLKEVTAENFQSGALVRFVGPMLVARQALSYLSPGPRSSFTITTGSSAEKPPKGWAVPVSYGGGLISMAKGLAIDMAPIRVNIVSPGAVDTEIWNGLGEEGKALLFKGFAGKMPTGRVGKVEDIAEAYLYTMKDENLTGTLISSNGGGLLI